MFDAAAPTSNIFGENYLRFPADFSTMDVEPLLQEADAPTGKAIEFLDARDLPPPEPLTKTMNSLAELDSETVFVQLNDRAPKFLFPKLDDRGFDYRTVETDDGTVTAIWRP
ncbi:hypothetical protein C455_06896 [Haloferax larsenii JCM 13917]|nr:hypothetical protein C455_06896 [Haloferax larsenii JCM 13917]